MSPTQGAVIKGGFVEVRYRLSKGAEATHIHCYVDGEYQKGFKGVVKGLARGSHEIKLVAASHDHDALGAGTVVTIEVDLYVDADESVWKNNPAAVLSPIKPLQL